MKIIQAAHSLLFLGPLSAFIAVHNMIKFSPSALRLLLAIYTTLVLATGYAAPAIDLSSDDQHFLALRDAASKEDAARAAELAGQLDNYALSSYVDYYRLKAHLRSAGENEITDFLTRYANTAIADRLRNDWLLMLGHQGNWKTFDAQYAQFVLNDDTQVKCYALLSRLKQGQNVAEDARRLLTSARVYGEGCYALFSGLVESGQFNHTDMWNQIRWAAEANSTSVAVQLAKLADQDKTAMALEKPDSRLTAELARPLGKSEAAHETALILLGRLSKTDIDKALASLAGLKDHLTVSERAIAWSQLALAAAQKLQPEAADYWKKSYAAPLSADAYQWRVRTALHTMDWKNVKAGIEAMPASLLGEPAWVYWLGRAYLAENKPDVAQSLFQSIAGRPHFYGQLALEESGLQIVVPPATPVQTLDLVALSSNVGLQHAFQFYGMNLRTEGNREWNWQLRSMSEPQILAAAELARQHDLLDRMVSTSDRSTTIFDFSQRFPAPHAEIMAHSTGILNLDMAWVYGLIRQESRFIRNARSNVGANGLMQVMPGTARYVVKKMKWDNVDVTRMDDIETNILLGTNYLNIILGNLNGSEVLASAGYNAGPKRARAWRESLDKMVEGAIFTETIPFPETRDYVKNVMSNATYYAALFSGKPQSLKARLGMISPFVDLPGVPELSNPVSTNLTSNTP